MNEQAKSQSTREVIRSSGAPVQVQVITTDFSHHPFTHRWRFGCDEWCEGAIVLPEGNDHDLHFELVDDAQKGVRFKNEPKHAFGATKGHGCPKGGDDGGGEIDFHSSTTTGNGTRLFIRDHNHEKCRLTYALYFDGPAGYEKYDPIIENNGGGPPTFSNR